MKKPNEDKYKQKDGLSTFEDGVNSKFYIDLDLYDDLDDWRDDYWSEKTSNLEANVDQTDNEVCISTNNNEVCIPTNKNVESCDYEDTESDPSDVHDNGDLTEVFESDTTSSPYKCNKIGSRQKVGTKRKRDEKLEPEERMKKKRRILCDCLDEQRDNDSSIGPLDEFVDCINYFEWDPLKGCDSKNSNIDIESCSFGSCDYSYYVKDFKSDSSEEYDYSEYIGDFSSDSSEIESEMEIEEISDKR